MDYFEISQELYIFWEIIPWFPIFKVHKRPKNFAVVAGQTRKKMTKKTMLIIPVQICTRKSFKRFNSVLISDGRIDGWVDWVMRKLLPAKNTKKLKQWMIIMAELAHFLYFSGSSSLAQVNITHIKYFFKLNLQYQVLIRRWLNSVHIGIASHYTSICIKRSNNVLCKFNLQIIYFSLQ